MKKLLLVLLCIDPLYSMEEVTPDVENQIIRKRADTVSSDLEEQIDDLLKIFDDVTKIEDADYVRMIMEILVKNKGETYHHISPYLRNRLRHSRQEIQELTQLRKRSTLKKLMKNLMAESIEEAFTKQRNRYEELDREAEKNVKIYRYVLVGTIVTGLSTTLAAFFAAYFSHCA